MFSEYSPRFIMFSSSLTLLPSLSALSSPFCDQPCYEFPTPELINGFIQSKMGVSFSNNEGDITFHQDEHIMYNKYNAKSNLNGSFEVNQG